VTGRYAALEGIEGAGKSTVAAGVVSVLQARGRPVLGVREPGGTRTGERVRRIVLEPEGEVSPWAEALLFAAARAQLAVELIAPALAAGSWVIGDRSVYSSLAYQGYGRGLGVDTVRNVNAAGLGGVWPDVVVLLRLDPGLGLERQAVPDRIGSEGLDLQRRVAEGFDRLAAAEPGRFVVVDAAARLDAVVDEVATRLEELWTTSSPV
jgi:dTMP kinase